MRRGLGIDFHAADRVSREPLGGAGRAVPMPGRPPRRAVPRRIVRRRQVAGGVGDEHRLAAVAAEMEGPAVVLGPVRGGLRVHLHAADRIGRQAAGRRGPAGVMARRVAHVIPSMPGPIPLRRMAAD